MADNDQPQFTIPAELSSILATLAQFAPQNAASSHPPPLQQDQQYDDDSYTPPASVDPVQQPYQSYLPNSVSATSLFPGLLSGPSQSQQQQQHPQPPQFYQLSQDPRFLNRSRTNTPDTTTLSHPNPLPGPSNLLSNQHAYSQNSHPLDAIASHQQSQQQPQQVHSNDPRPVPQGRSSTAQAQSQGQASVTPTGLVIDPASITEWTAGLRCVNKIATQNREFVAAIRRMITNQQKHEMQWYQGRQELKQMQARRVTGASEIHSILSSVSGGAFPLTKKAPPAPLQTQEEKEAELAAFDAKVYRAQVSMNENMTAELKALGVPFFGTNEDRIKADDDDGHGDAGEGVGPKWSPRITRVELLALQRRIVGHLEDMYKG